MKTPVPVGVFNKGKASEKTRIKDKSAVMSTSFCSALSMWLMLA